MKQTPLIIKVPSVYFVKLPHGEWVNLALVRSVEVLEYCLKKYWQPSLSDLSVQKSNLYGYRAANIFGYGSREESPDSLVPNINHVIVRLTFDNGESKAYWGALAAAIVEALAEMTQIDTSGVEGAA